MTAYSIAGRVQFGSILGVEQLTITRSRGIQPASFQLVVFELPQLPITSTSLMLSDGTNSHIFKDCILQGVEADYSSGERYIVTILDYRWKWKFGELSGEYNKVVAGEIVKRTKKNTRDLAITCLKAMGVSSYSVDAMPQDLFPEITWDLEVPAVALETLCTSVGCVVCPGVDGKVTICKQGVGKNLPAMAGGQVTDAIKCEPIPDALNISGDPTIWELSLELGEALGIEKNGSIVPIDKLSYRPPNGWGRETPDKFSNVSLDFRDLAIKSVWRFFSFKLPIKTPYFNVTDITEIFFEDTLVEKEDVLGVPTRKMPVVYGRFYDNKEAHATNVDVFSHDYEVKTKMTGRYKKKLVFDGSFTINKERMIIEFGDPVYLRKLVKDKWVCVMPDVRVRCAVGLRSPVTGAKEREVYYHPTGRKNGTSPQWIKKSEVRRELILDPKSGGASEDNRDEVEKKLKEYAEFEMRKIEAVKPRQGTYSGFPLIELDGTIEQVTYTVTAEGFAETQASYGSEHSFVMPTFEERKRYAWLAAYEQQEREQNKGKNKKTR